MPATTGVVVPNPPAETTAAPETRVRIEAVDLLRGIIMVLMALDHVRDYFGDLAANPTNLETTTIPLFFTRWVTHFCAPVFFLLTGTGASLALEKRGHAGLSRFLFTRGLWLILLEFTVVRFLWQFNLNYEVTVLTVFWALGWSMIVLAGLVHLPVSATTAIGAAMIATHNLFDPVQASAFGVFAPVWSALHSPNVLWADAGHMVFAAYPLIPWVGVTAVGYGLGQIYSWPAERRRTLLLRLGVAFTLGFILLRAANVYGDPRPWQTLQSAEWTLLSFLNTNKYPPSLLFLLMTLGPALLLLRAFDGGFPRVLRPAVIIGKVPFFYYLMHILLMHVAAVGAAWLRYGNVHWMFASPTLDKFPITQPPGWPMGLPGVYLIWIAVVAALYPLCHWFAGVRARRRSAWLSYL